MLTALVLHLAVAQVQPWPADSKGTVAVLVSRRVGLPAQKADAIAARVAEYLERQGVARTLKPAQIRPAVEVLGMKDPAECDGRRACVSGLARVLKVWGVVSLDLALLDKDISLHLELISAERAEPLTTVDHFATEKAFDTQLYGALDPLAKAVRDALAPAAAVAEAPTPAPAPPPADAPRQVQLAPTPAQTPAVEAAPRQRGSVVPGAVVTGLAAAAAVTSIVLLAQGLTAKSDLEAKRDPTRSTPVYQVTEAEARRLADSANANFSASLGTGIGAGALAVLGVVLFVAR